MFPPQHVANASGIENALEDGVAATARAASAEFNVVDSTQNSRVDKQPMNSIYAHPSLREYYTHLTPFITLSIFIGCLLVILNVSIYCTTVSKLRKRLNKPLLGSSIAMCSLYPLISCSAMLTILVPISWLATHTIMHLSFTVGALIFRQLCFKYVDSEINYIKETDGATFTINTPPCCCCCLCLPRVMPTKAKLCIIRYMVYQMPFVQGSIMLVLNGIYYKQPDLYKSTSVYFIPFIVSSILIGVWGLNITVRMVNSIHAEYGLMKKMFALQLVLLLCKLQYLLLDYQLDNVILGGPYPINHTIYKQTIINLLILAEMVLVSLLTQNAYKTPVQIVEK